MENMEQCGIHRAQNRTKAQVVPPKRKDMAKCMSPGLLRVRKVAMADRNIRFTSLLHHIAPDSLRKSYHALKRHAAPGVDGCTWEEYQKDLENRLKDLHDRIHRGAYRALPCRRVHIPKADGQTRPLGIAALEDKIVQQSVSEILGAIYETDFYGFSYGFRAGRNCHDALNALYVAIEKKKISWILDADIQRFFDSISHDWMLRFLGHRIADKRVLRLIAKWLKAGVLENGKWQEVKLGTPQGAVISPILANIYLHYVLDDWLDWWRRKHAKGDVIIVRYADDFVMGFQYQHEASKFLAALKERLNAFALNLHPEKTRLIEFGRFAARNRRQRGEGKPETFTFLGFTHICSVNRKDGKFKILRRTDKKRMREKLSRLKVILQAKMHDGVEKTGQWLKLAVQGYYNYFAVPDNMRSLYLFRDALVRIWYKTLRRRCQKRRMNWEKFGMYIKCWIPKPRILYPYPSLDFCVTHP